MSIVQVTVKDENRYVEAFRQHLRSEARRFVQDHPNRVGKRFAEVEFPAVVHQSVYLPGALEMMKVEFV